MRLKNFLPFSSNLKMSSTKSFSFEGSKIYCLVKGENNLYRLPSVSFSSYYPVFLFRPSII